MGSQCFKCTDELPYEEITGGDDREGVKQFVDAWYEIFHKNFGEVVTKQHILEIYNIFCPMRNNEVVYNEIIRRYANESHGGLDFLTFIKALCDACRYGSELTTETFAMFDLNRVGELTQEEVEQIAASHEFMKGNHEDYIAMGYDITWDMFSYLDVNATGKITMSSYHQIAPDDANSEDEKKRELYEAVHFVDPPIAALIAIANNVYHLLGGPV